MTLQGQHIVVLDCETLHSAQDCRHCGLPKEAHGYQQQQRYQCLDDGRVYEAIGWDDHAALGLSIGCLYHYATDHTQFFEPHTLEATLLALLHDQPLIVSFNGRQFDGPLMAAVYSTQMDLADDQGILSRLTQPWQTLWDASYDLLAAIWQVDPERKFERGLNSLDALSQANGFGATAMDGADAPRRWAQGRVAEVVTYCLTDVWRTRKLFELVWETGQVLRGDGQPIQLPRPILPSTA